MNNRLYKDLINDISKIIKESLHMHLNEMARKSVLRTIDKKLWLTVASTCSRNKSNEAEFVKPVGNDKDNLILRYVAALLVMKKPCPNSIEEINDLKTFKLYGKRIMELGGTIEEIQYLYNKNSGITSTANKSSNKETKTTNNTDKSFDSDINNKLNNSDNTLLNNKSSIMSGSLFDDDDDDFFDDDSDLSDIIYKTSKLETDMSLDVVLADKLGIAKPRGYKLYKPTLRNKSNVPDDILNEEYECYYTEDRAPSRYYCKKSILDFRLLLMDKKWTYYSIDFVPSSSLFQLDIEQYKTDEEAKEAIEHYWLDDYVGIYDLQQKIDKTYDGYLELKKDRETFIKNLPDGYLRDLAVNDNRIYIIWVSPDGGLVYTIKHIHSGSWLYTLTFTGNVNYKYNMNDEQANKNKVELVKLQNKKKQKFYKLTKDYCGLGGFKWSVYFDNGDEYPYSVSSYDKKTFDILYRNFTKGYPMYGRHGGPMRYLYINKDNKESGSEFDIILNGECYKGSYVLLTGYKDIYNKYSNSPDRYYVKMSLTEQGKNLFDILCRK